MGILERAVNVGDRAPDFSLSDPQFKMVQLSKLLSDGPVVLTWYRGGWCPYCNIQLRAMQEVLPEIKALGGSLVALSPEIPDNSLDTREKNALEYYVLSDLGNRVAREYNLVYKLPARVAEQFEGRLDISAHNGDDSLELPLSATYVIDQDGTVTYAFIDTDYRNRAEPAEILSALARSK